MPIKNLSVFFPLYNEAGNVKNSIEKTIRVLDNLKIEYEILLIDDGSSDQTRQIADGLSSKNPAVKVIHHQKNLGYGEALKSGFYNAKYETIVYTDGDGQFDFSEVTKFLEKIKDYDLVIGYRIKRKDPFFRILFKKGWKLSLLTFFGLIFKDVDCGFKMIRKKVLEKIPHLQSQRGAMISAELVIKAQRYGFRVTEVGVSHYPRLSGKPTGASINVIIKSYIDLLRLWWGLKDQKILFLILLVVLVLAAFLRFYRLSEYMTFLGDEGRDALIVKDILTFKNLPLIGPPTSVGNIYLGPIYYYMMAVAMGIFWLNPVAAAGMNALIGVTTVFLIYYFGKIWFGKIPGLISAFLYTISPVTIIYSKSSWNPNPTPLFALLAILGIHLSQKFKNFRWLILAGASFAASLQMHYLALILLPILAVFWIKEFLKREGKYFWQGTIIGILAFIILMSPLVVFDFKHNFLNYRAITELITKGSVIETDITGNIARIPQIYVHNLIGRYIAGENIFLTALVSFAVIFSLFKKSWSIFVLGVWLLVGLLGLSFYRQSIYDHYLGFFNPVPFILLGSLVYTFHVSSKRKGVVWMFIFFLMVGLTIVNFQKSPLNNPPNNQLKRTQNVAKFIIRESEGKPFNFALLAQRNYDAAYQFYLGEYGHKPKQVPFVITDQLFVVCEDPVCNPVGHPKQEISHFGWVKIEKEWEVHGVRIYKLIHNPEGRPQ